MTEIRQAQVHSDNNTRHIT